MNPRSAGAAPGTGRDQEDPAVALQRMPRCWIPLLIAPIAMYLRESRICSVEFAPPVARGAADAFDAGPAVEDLFAPTTLDEFRI
jgi:hypothetical protein